MKYFKIETVTKAYKGFQDAMTNKSWGYLSILKACNEVVNPGQPCDVDLDEVSNFLESIFNISDTKKTYNSGKTWSVIFSNRWQQFFSTQGHHTPNIFDVAVWAYRRKGFPDSYTEQELLSDFASEFHIPLAILQNSFLTKETNIAFEEYIYPEQELREKLAQEGVNISSGNVDAQKKSVQASPGEISRGPFVQPLYAGLEISDYVIILLSEYNSLYGDVTLFSNKPNRKPLSHDDLVRKYVQLVTSEYSTAGNAIFMASYGYDVMENGLKASDIYSKAGELYPEYTQKFRPQELNHAYKMYNYFVKHPENMHLPGIVTEMIDNTPLTDFTNKPLQKITYGAPGTGKSHGINIDTKGQAVIRTTFHPDSDYSTFVGAYKPTMTKVRKCIVIDKEEREVTPLVENSKYESKIQYSFVKQAFLKAYLGAWKKYTEPKTDDEGKEIILPQFLVIEEINRGNCAQIFGDLFQLLDRQDNKFSSYPIEADADLKQEIANAFKNDPLYKLSNNINVEGIIKDYTSNYADENGNPCTLSDDIQSGRVLLLPKNLYIWATMNTSDQSLFPIDSAFKRRWDWEYVRISEGRDKQNNNEPLRWYIAINEEQYDWWSFLNKINERIGSITSSEDKKLGYFFCKADDGKISAEKFVSKVCFYLWNDVFKDFGFGKKDQSAAFKKENGKEIAFDDFYTEDPETFKSKVNEDLLETFMQKLEVDTVAKRLEKENKAAENNNNNLQQGENITE